MTEKVCTDQHYPKGDWVKATMMLTVAGTSYRETAVDDFVKKARAAEELGLKYTLELEREPTNKHDPNAIKIIGVSEHKSFLGSLKSTSWHIGYVDAQTAAEFTAEFIKQGVKISVVLYAIYLNPPYTDVNYMLLAPPGNSFSARQKRSR